MENMEPPLPPYTTLASTIKNLEKKGYLSSRLIGNAYLYKPLITEEAYKKKFINKIVENYFSNSYKELVSFFVQQKKLSAKELKEIFAAGYRYWASRSGHQSRQGNISPAGRI